MKYGPHILFVTMTVIVIMLPVLLMMTRNPAEAEREEIKALQKRRAEIGHDFDVALLDLINKKKELQFVTERLNTLSNDLNVMQALAAGQGVRYVLTVTLKQTSYSLDLEKHLKNALNAQDFDLVVDKLAYDAANPGDNLFKAFRTGSLLVNGDIGSWKLTVKSKRIAILPAVEK